MPLTEKSMSVRLLYSKDRKEFLMMEVGRDFLDLLYSFVSLPFASIVNLLQGSGNRLMLANMRKLLLSLQEMREDSTSHSLWPTAELQKSRPTVSLLPEEDPLNTVYCCDNLSCDSPSLAMTPHLSCPHCKGAMITPVTLPPEQYSLYYCTSCSYRSSASKRPRAFCRKCGNSMGRSITLANNPAVFVQVASAEHLAKDSSKFLVTEGLAIMPASAIAGMMLLSKAQRSREIGWLDVSLAPEEVMELLRASVTSKCVLNKVFAVHINGQK